MTSFPIYDEYDCLRHSYFTLILTLNVPVDRGSSRPTRVEPRLHYVGIARQVRGRCTGSAAHSLFRAIAAHALSAARKIEPRSTHFARVSALGVPLTQTIHTHFAYIDILVHVICDSFSLRVKEKHDQYSRKPIPYSTRIRTASIT